MGDGSFQVYGFARAASAALVRPGVYPTLCCSRRPPARVAIDDLYRAYATRVKPEERLPLGKFAEEVAKFCKKIGIRTIDGKAHPADSH
jgi:hypothetical protein